MLQQIKTQLAGLPIAIHYLSDSTIAFSPLGQFNTIVDNDGRVIYDNEGIHVEGEHLEWATQYEYKDIPSVLEWLQRENLVEPVVQKG